MVDLFGLETQVSLPIRVKGNFSYLSWGLDTAFGETLTLTLNQNYSSTDLAISIGPSVTGWVTDSSDIVSVASGDLLDFVANVGGAETIPYTGAFYCVSARFDSTDIDKPNAQIATAVGPHSVSPNPQVFVNFLGTLGAGESADTTQQFKCIASGIPNAGTWQNMACHLDSNGLDVATTVTNRINSVNGSMSISIAASTSGYFEDTTDSDTVQFGDLLDYGCLAMTGTGSFTMDWIGAHFLATDPTQCMIGGSAQAPLPLIVGSSGEVDNYSSLFGGGNPESAAARSTGLIPYAATASMFTNYITGTRGASVKFTLEKNDGPSELTSNTSEEGYSMDSTHTVAFAVADTCTNYMAITVSVGTSITWANAGLLLRASD